MPKNNGLKLALEYFGTIPKLAAALGINRQAVYMWKGRIPKARAYELESITRGRLSAEKLLQ
jgi:hypothetical protein